jgi:hypothetical protein
MSEDSFTEVTNQSWFSRIGDSIKGILAGLTMVAVAFFLLFWNEGRAVKQYKTLKEGGKTVISVSSDSVDAANAGKLLHVTGRAVTDATLTDPVFGVSANALRLKRVVTMYQWKETSKSDTKEKLGGGTETTKTYSYSKVWSDRVISSSEFKVQADHQNPTSLPYEPSEQIAAVVTFGAFTLSPSLVYRINNFEPLPASNDVSLPESLKAKVKRHDSGFYIGSDPSAAQIGDARISFMVAKPTEVSVIAAQVGKTFEPYRTKTSGNIELLQTGVHSAEAMIQQAQENNRNLTWILRLVGFILMLSGLNMMLRPLSVLSSVVPVLGTIVGAGLGLVAFLLAALLSLVTIAIAWIVYRPLLGIVLIIVAVSLALVIKGKLKSAKVEKA